MSKPDISIVIRTLNEQRYLGDLLQGIQDQQSEFTYEVVLIDSGSTDATLSVAKQFGCRILHIRREDFSFGRSLNRACEASVGNYLVFVSGHCIPYDQYWLQNLVKPLHAGIVEYCYGRQIGGPHTHWSESQIFSKYFPISSKLPQKGFYCNNANSALSSDVWRTYKFNEKLTGLEDMCLAKRLLDNQGVVGYAANACVYHLHHETWSQIQRRFEREALALQHISPEIILRRRDIARYFIRGVSGDIVKKPQYSLNPVNCYKIVRYRFHQYLGSYYGNHLHKRASSELRDTYFYPTPSKGAPLINRTSKS
jgi:rhamnosyltransferase